MTYSPDLLPFGRSAALVLVAALFHCVPLEAQKTDSTTVRRDTVSRPFVRGGVYDKPFLTRLGARTAIGGYAEAHARWEQVDGTTEDAGFEAKRFNLFTNTRVSDFVQIGAELEFEDGGSEIKLEYAAIDLRIHPSLTLRGGMLLSPLGRFNLSHDSPLNEFTDRPVVSTELLGVALSEPGFGAFGQVGFARTWRATYELYATNGFHAGLIETAEEGTRIPFGRGNVEDNNASPAFVGRVALSPREGFELGLSAHRGAYNTFEVDGLRVDDRRELTIAVVDVEARLLGATFSGEAAVASIDIAPGLTDIYASRQRGAFLEGALPFGRGWVRTMPASSFAIKSRFDVVDFDAHRVGQTVSQLSAGINFRPTQDSVLKLDYVRGRRRDEFNNRSNHAFVLFSLATYF
ncbi:MAG: hypothetical protein ABI877_02925 [Gemmatimonadaceae bacterium]